MRTEEEDDQGLHRQKLPYYVVNICPRVLKCLEFQFKASLWTDDFQTSHERSQHFRDDNNALCHAPAML
jgi:hypothetical protein